MPDLLPRILALIVAGLLALTASAQDRAEPAWAKRLLGELATVDSNNAARIGVYVRDLDTGATASYKADESWYLASMVKVPVAIAVLRGMERGLYTLDTPLTLRASDLVDGAGGTSRNAVGTPLTLRYLLEQMIIYSDNTASDMLIGLAGLADVNDTVASLVPEGFERITTLAAVRHSVYGYLDPEAAHLAGRDLILLNQQKVDTERLKLLAHLLGTTPERFRVPTLEAAYRSYYATRVNSGRLDAYGELIALLADGKALNPSSTRYLLSLMQRTATGPLRIKAGLPPDVSYAHKTGTQRRRTCDAGIVTVQPQQRVVVVACTRGELALDRSELALRQVGAALCRSGLITHGVIDAPYCHAPASPARRPVSPRR